VTRQLSLHHLTRLEATPAELVDAAARAGFAWCGLRIVPVEDEPLVDLVHDTAARRDLARRMSDQGVGLLDVEAVWLRPPTVVADLAPALAAAAELGASEVLSVGADPETTRQIDRLGELSGLAREHGLRVALEPITYSAVPDLATALQVAEATGDPDVAVLIDSLQLFRAGTTLVEVARLPRARLRYLQLSDAVLPAPSTVAALRDEARGDRRIPGEGDLDLVGLVAALPPELPIAIECPTRALRDLPLAEAAALLRRATERITTAAHPDRSTP